MAKKHKVPPKASNTLAQPNQLHSEIRQLILEARQQTAQTVNAALTLTYWHIGERIRKEILQEKRAEYGEEIVVSLARQLEAEFGRGFSAKSLRHMLRFAEAFPDLGIVSALSRQLAWSHFMEIVYLKDQLKRDFYAEMCRIERWSVRALRERIGSMLFERTAISKKPEKLIEQELQALREEDRLTPDLVFRDPYFLDFLGLKDTYSENDLEAAILREMESFLLELGSGFAFVERQKRITIDGEDFYLDLLFFHRKLRCLVCVELKLDELKSTDAGQLELYLRWLERNERQSGEGRPIGLILCAGKKKEMAEYLNLDDKGIHVAEYLTDLPPRDLLERRLRDAVSRARSRLADDSQPASAPAKSKSTKRAK